MSKSSALALVSCVALLAVVATGCGTPADPAPEDVSSVSSEVKIDCSYVKCAMPECGPRQHLSNQGCCPTCVGPEDRCATVLCAAVVCADDEIAVTAKGQCCPQCQKRPSVKECRTSADCPIYYCIQCPCPYSECRGGSCVTQTPDSSTCTDGPVAY